MDAPVYSSYLANGQKTFAEYRTRAQSGQNPLESESVEGESYLELGKKLMERFRETPEAFISETGLSLPDVAFLTEEPVPLQSTGTAPMTDLLDSLVQMPVDVAADPEPLMIESVTYDFEQSVPVEDLGPQPKEWLDNGNLEGQKQGLEEKQANSEVASTHGSESVFGFRSADRMERKSNFSVLQEHINTLTEENCDLRRALELQQRLTANLTQENQTVGDEFNIQAQKLEDLQTKCTHYESLLKEQQESLESLSRDFAISKAAEQGAQERVRALVQENVELEDRIRDMRVAEIRLEKTVERAQDEADALTKQERRTEIENRNLTDILNNIREENNLLRAQIHTPHHSQLLEIPQQRTTTETAGTEREVLPVVTRNVETQTDHDELPRTPPSHPATPQVSGYVDRGLLDESILQNLISDEAASELTSDERQVLSSVHELMNALDDQRRAMIAKLRSARIEIQRLKMENGALTQKVSNQTQILEMQVQRDVHKQLSQTDENPSMTHLTSMTSSLPKSNSGSGFFNWFGAKSRARAVQEYLE